MPSNDLFNKLRQFDAYPKTLEDFRVKTFGGAAITIIAGLLMAILFISELNYFLTTEVHPELFVDTARDKKIQINMDIVFPRMPCAYLSVDAMDVSGEQQIDVAHHVIKRRLDLDGNSVEGGAEKHELGDHSEKLTEEQKELAKLDPNRCESCYGAEDHEGACCNTCEDVRESYRKKGWAFNNADGIEQCSREGWSDKLKDQKNEGCQVAGYLEVNKVAGNFHFAPGKSFSQHHVHVHDLKPFAGMKFNMTHRIKKLMFGQDVPGVKNPLDDTEVVTEDESLMFQYYVKVVPTTYEKLSGELVDTNQFSVTTHKKQVSGGLTGAPGLPGVFFIYELSPMMIKYAEKRRSFMHFLTGVCAIIGGIFTVASLIDSLVYHSAKAIQKKIDLGKQT